MGEQPKYMLVRHDGWHILRGGKVVAELVEPRLDKGRMERAEEMVRLANQALARLQPDTSPEK